MSTEDLYPTVGSRPAYGTRRKLADRELTNLIGLGFRQGASDILLSVGTPPRMRLAGRYLPTGPQPLTGDDVRILVAALLTPAELQRFEQSNDIDLGLDLEGLGRLRANAFRTRGQVALSLRLIPSRVPTVQELKLPAAIVGMMEFTRGLVLVTGAAGSGKSTMLAALVHHLNSERQLHIVTMEDPIEFVHPSLKSVVSQREVGPDTDSFDRALRAVLRQAPDVILVGEMRDPETIRAVLTVAETGHLVLSTLHTMTATQTLSRIIDAMPPDARQQVRSQLALTLRGIVSLALLPAPDFSRNVAAREILVMNTGIASMIREGLDHLVINAIQTGASQGMVTMEASIGQLLDQKLVDPHSANQVMNSFRTTSTGRSLTAGAGTGSFGLPSTRPPDNPPVTISRRRWSPAAVLLILGVVVALQYQNILPTPAVQLEAVLLVGVAVATAVLTGLIGR